MGATPIILWLNRPAPRRPRQKARALYTHIYNRANDACGGPAGQCLSRRAARAGTAADRFQVSLSPALGLARILGAGPAKGGAEASRGGPLAPGEKKIPPYANKHVIVVRPEAAFEGCLHACSTVSRWCRLSTGKQQFSSRKRCNSSNCFSFGPKLILGGAYMLVRQVASSPKRVSTPPRNRISTWA